MKAFSLFFLVMAQTYSGISTSLAAPLSEGKVHFSLTSDTQLAVTIDQGFHINQEAPAKILGQKGLILKPETLSAKAMSFDLTSLKGDKFKVNFYVCDDQNTSCEQQKAVYTVKEHALVASSFEEETSKPTEQKTVSYNHHHFITDNLNGALALAQKEKKLLFVDFGAPWCPACVRLETEVFGEKSFKDLTKNLIKVTLNSDLMDNSEYYKKYNVHLLPTLIVMNEEGEELYRMIDYRPLPDFNKTLAAGLKNSTIPLRELTALAEKKDPKAMEILAERALMMNDYPEALKWLKEDTFQYAVAKSSVLGNEYEKDKKNETEYRAFLKKIIALYPKTYESLDWRLALSDLDKTNAQTCLKDNLIILNEVLHDKKERQTMFSNTSVGTICFPVLEIHSYLVKTYEKLDDKKLLEEAQNAFKSEIKKVKTSVKKPGEYLMIVQYQREIKMPEEEQSLKALAKAYSKSHVYHMKLGGYYVRQKDFKKALPELKLSTSLEKPVSLFNLSLLAKAQKGLGLKEDMKTTIELADNSPEASLERSRDLLKSMHDLMLQ